MVNSDYSIYQKPKSWISRLSIRARGIVTKTQLNVDDDDQISILSAPEILPSPASSVTSINPTDDDDDDDDDDCSDFVTPSSSSSTSSCTSIFSVKNHDETNQNQRSENQEKKQEQERQDKKQSQITPPSPTLTAQDRLYLPPQPETINHKLFPSTMPTNATKFSKVLPPLENNSYFSPDRPLPTKRRTPGRSRHSAIDINKSARDSVFLNINNEQTRHSVALEQLAQDTLTYFVDTSSSPASRPSSEITTNSELCDKNDDPTTKLVEKLKSRLTSSSSTSTAVHPSVLKLAQDVMAYMKDTLPLTNECQQLKPKLEVCLLIHGKTVN